MKIVVLIALLAASCSAAAAGDTFGVYLFTTFGAPGAKSWSLSLQGGVSETIALEAVPVLDGTAIASADAERGPDGGGTIRLVLTPAGARKLAQATTDNVGRRLGIVVAGRLRAAPHVLAGITNGVLVVGGLKPGEAEGLARTLGPPAPRNLAPAAPEAAGAGAVFRVLEGTWILRRATHNGEIVPDQKFASGTWTFSGGTLSAANGEGGSARFTLAADPASPNAFRLDPVPPSKERSGWMLFRREGDRLVIAFFDGFSDRPVDFAPAPKKVILELSRQSSR